MPLIVQKYGGTSVGSIDRIHNVADKVIQAYKKYGQIIVVVSAMTGETDRLLELAHSITPRPDPREMDVLLATGEQVAIALLSMALLSRGYSARSYTGPQIKVITDSSHTKARILDINCEKISEDLEKDRIVVVAGFQGVDEIGNITTLGRGGSDTTAVALAVAFKADECQIYTDVDGVYTADPRIVSAARRMDRITFEEMLELASLGAKVLQIRAVEFAGKYNVPLRVLSTFEEGSGTLITYEDNHMEQAIIAGIAYNRKEAKLTLLGVPDVPGVASGILTPISNANIEVDIIVQNMAENGLTDFSFTVSRTDYHKAYDILREVANEINAKGLSGDDRIAKVSLVGVGMRSHAGIASKMFRTLGQEGVNIQMITTSEIKVSVVVDEKYLELAVRALHTAFGLDAKPQEDEI